MLFRVKAGKYVQGEKVFEIGDTVESDRDLVKTFPNKFELVEKTVYVPVEAPQAAPSQASPPSEPAKAEDVKEDGEQGAEKTDVTEDFPAALENGLRVLKEDNRFNIYDVDDFEKALNSKPFKKVKQVDDFITAYAAE